VANVEETRGVYGVLIVKPEGKRPLEKLRRRWEDNIQMFSVYRYGGLVLGWCGSG
jgi:hypothetical protein